MSENHDARWYLRQEISGWQARVERLTAEKTAREEQRTALDEADEEADAEISRLEGAIKAAETTYQEMERVGPGYVPPQPASPRRRRTGTARGSKLPAKLREALAALDQGNGVTMQQVEEWAAANGESFGSLRSVLYKEAKDGGIVQRHPESKNWMLRPAT